MWRFFWRAFWIVGVIALLAIVALGGWMYPQYQACVAVAERADLEEINRIPAISEVFDGAGRSYSRLEGEVRYVVPFSGISPHFVQALLAREDSRFYEHHGVDFTGIARAAGRNLLARAVREGASTITQQLARNTFDLGPDRWRRKGIEALLAQRIERHFSKEQILEAYANRIYFGIGLYGVETAARACFGKSAADLTLSEAAILAGLIRSPNRISPLKDSGTALVQRDQVLARMEQLKMIDAREAAAARAEPMPAGKRQPPHLQENYAMDAVTRELAILLPKETIARGGLKIFTTIDRRLQLLAETAVEEKLAELEAQKVVTPGAAGVAGDRVQGALVAIDNVTGGLLAIVGGRNFKESPYNRAWLAKRQVGSTFKPFIYAAAFQRGMAPDTPVDDSPLRDGEIAGLNGSWTPENSEEGNLGLQPASVGLIRSRNTMTVRVGKYATRAAVRALAGQAGLENVPDLPAIYLGAFESTLKNLTAAYTMFPNGGVRRQPFIIDHIEDRAGRTIYKATRAELRCLPEGVSAAVSGLLGEVLKTGTGATARGLGLTVPAAGKTGTTDDYRDAWFVGYTTRLTCGVWVGKDRPQRIADRGYGSRLALPIWVDFVEQASAWKYDAKEFPPPPVAPAPPSAQLVADAVPVPVEPNPGGVATPVAKAVAVEAATPPPNARYRVIRTERGLQFQYGQ